MCGDQSQQYVKSIFLTSGDMDSHQGHPRVKIYFFMCNNQFQ